MGKNKNGLKKYDNVGYFSFYHLLLYFVFLVFIRY